LSVEVDGQGQCIQVNDSTISASLRAYIRHKFAFDMSGEVLPFLDSAVVPFKAAAAEDLGS
jgi:hypothetical protein